MKYRAFSRDADYGLVDLEEVHSDTVPGVGRERTRAQADNRDVAEPPVGHEREDDVAERTGRMVVRGRQGTHLPRTACTPCVVVPCVSTCQSPF